MPKAISVAPSIPKELVGRDGKTVTITEARIVRDQWTSIGTLKLGLGLVVDIDDDEFSQLFSLDRDILTGSVGRILVDAGVTEFDKNISDEHVQVLVGRHYRVVNRGDKLYWYAPKD